MPGPDGVGVDPTGRTSDFVIPTGDYEQWASARIWRQAYESNSDTRACWSLSATDRQGRRVSLRHSAGITDKRKSLIGSLIDTHGPTAAPLVLSAVAAAATPESSEPPRAQRPTRFSFCWRGNRDTLHHARAVVRPKVLANRHRLNNSRMLSHEGASAGFRLQTAPSNGG